MAPLGLSLDLQRHPGPLSRYTWVDPTNRKPADVSIAAGVPFVFAVVGGGDGGTRRKGVRVSHPHDTKSELVKAALAAEGIHWLRNIEPGEQLRLPGIDFAPSKVQAHGYREAHTWPLVARHKGEAFRIHASKAWAFPSIELRTANSWPCLILDCDNPEAALAAIYTTHRAFGGTALPMPNWTVQRRSSLHFHPIYCLSRPVLRGAQARSSPLRRFARISEFYRQTTQADAGFNGVLSHNPMCGGPRSRGCLREGAKYYVKRVTVRSEAGRNPYSGEDLYTLLAQLALRADVPVERHGLDAEFAA